MSGWGGTRAEGWGRKDAVDRPPLQRPRASRLCERNRDPGVPHAEFLQDPGVRFQTAVCTETAPAVRPSVTPLSSPDPQLPSWNESRALPFLSRASFGTRLLCLGTLREAENAHSETGVSSSAPRVLRSGASVDCLCCAAAD